MNPLRNGRKERVGGLDRPDGWESADYYSKVNIDAQPFISAVYSGDIISPRWRFDAIVDRVLGDVPITIQLWDRDDGLRGADDHCDIHRICGIRDLNLSLNLSTRRISGDLTGDAGVLLRSVGGGDSDREIIWFTIDVR